MSRSDESSDSEGEVIDDTETPIDLGYAEDALHPLQLTAQYFPSLLGGVPVWLNPERLPPADALMCPRCRETLTFLCQIYAPIRSRENNFHRTLFVFACSHCADTAVKCFRSNLPRVNPYYASTAPPKLTKYRFRKKKDASDELNERRVQWTDGASRYAVALCRVCRLPAPTSAQRERTADAYCSARHQNADSRRRECGDVDDVVESDTAATRPPSDLLVLRQRLLLPNYHIAIDSEYCAADQVQDAHAHALFERYEKTSADEQNDSKLDDDNEKAADDDGNDDDDDGDGADIFGSRRDAVFSAFQKRIAYNPEQIIRYARNTSTAPLWPAKENQMTAPPPCTCGAPRIFECQLMPQMIFYTHSAKLDWGTVVIFTCAESCGDGIESGYREEVAYVQKLNEQRKE